MSESMNLSTALKKKTLYMYIYIMTVICVYCVNVRPTLIGVHEMHCRMHPN